jgi:hypothetical protein
LKEGSMMILRTLAIGLIGIALSPSLPEAQGHSQYRDFQLGSNLAAVSTLAGVAPSEATTQHRRPAILQDLEWRPPYWTTGTTARSTDPVERIAFSFFNDQLFRVVVDYSRERTEGMTNADMIEAISADYGAPVKRLPGAVGVMSVVEAESGPQVARWGDADHRVVLYRTASYRQTFRLIVTATVLDDLARKAVTEAVRLDQREAPSRELARQKQDREDARTAEEKARVANKGTFRP